MDHHGLGDHTARTEFGESLADQGDRASAGGVDAPSFDDLWLDCRRHTAFGLMAWLTSLEWTNPEDIHAAAAVGRFAHAVIDLESATALA